MDSWTRPRRIGLAILTAVCVPFVVTGMYRLTARFDEPEWFWTSLPFALLGAAPVLIRQRSTWKPVASGIVMGSVFYGLFLIWLLSQF